MKLPASLKHFLRGFGSVLDIAPSPRPAVQLPPLKTVEEALRADWEKVGGDMWKVIGQGAKNNPRR